MSQVAIEKVDGNDYANKGMGMSSISGELEMMYERIRRRAFELFQRRGGQDGFAVDDWLRAERDLLQVPNAELVEQDGKYDVRVGAPGFEAGEVKVTATPEALIVNGVSTHKHDKSRGNLLFSEFGSKTLYRRIDLPEPINPDKVTASLDEGVLHLTAPKSTTAETRRWRAA